MALTPKEPEILPSQTPVIPAEPTQEEIDAFFEQQLEYVN